MKKNFVKIIALALMTVCALSFAACSSYGSLEKAFTDAGYTKSEKIEGTAKDIEAFCEKDNIAATAHVFAKSKGISSDVVLILEFNSTDDMKKLYDDSETVKGFVKDVASNEDAKEFYKTLENAGYAKGNCLVLSINPINRADVIDIVKKA